MPALNCKGFENLVPTAPLRRRPPRCAADDLRTVVKIAELEIGSNLTGDALWLRLEKLGPERDWRLQGKRWRAGGRAISAGMAEEAARLLGLSTSEVSEDLWALLNPRPVQKKSISEIEARNGLRCSGISRSFWCFDRPSRFNPQDAMLVAKENFAGLYARGDLPGFIALMILLRRYHQTSALKDFFRTAAYVIRALPCIAQLPLFASHACALVAVTKEVIATAGLVPWPWKIDEDVLWRQIRDPAHRPNMALRERDSIMLRRLDSFVGSSQAYDRRTMKSIRSSDPVAFFCNESLC